MLRKGLQLSISCTPTMHVAASEQLGFVNTSEIACESTVSKAKAERTTVVGTLLDDKS